MGCCCCKARPKNLPTFPETQTIVVPSVEPTGATATAPTLPTTAVTAPPQYVVHTPYAAGIYRPYTVYPTSAYQGNPAFTPYYQNPPNGLPIPSAPQLSRGMV